MGQSSEFGLPGSVERLQKAQLNLKTKFGSYRQVKLVIDRIVTFNGDLDQAAVGQSVTLTLTDEVDCSRGQIITASSASLEVLINLKQH